MPDKKPNILILWGDDIGWYNLSCHNQGTMGYRTPNIDRLAKEGLDRLLWPAELHRRPVGFYHGPESYPHRVDQGRYSRL